MVISICVSIIIDISLVGKNTFHVRNMSLSYRIRGIVPRIHTNRVLNTIVLIISHKFLGMIRSLPGINSVAVISLINRIFMYSAIKIMANSTPLYSVLNPDTSSDSPSARSNGVRFVSARAVVNHIIIS